MFGNRGLRSQSCIMTSSKELNWWFHWRRFKKKTGPLPNDQQWSKENRNTSAIPMNMNAEIVTSHLVNTQQRPTLYYRSTIHNQIYKNPISKSVYLLDLKETKGRELWPCMIHHLGSCQVLLSPLWVSQPLLLRSYF